MGVDSYLCKFCDECVSECERWFNCMTCNTSKAICGYCFDDTMKPNDDEMKEIYEELKYDNEHPEYDPNIIDKYCCDAIKYIVDFNKFKEQFDRYSLVTDRNCGDCIERYKRDESYKTITLLNRVLYNDDLLEKERKYIKRIIKRII